MQNKSVSIRKANLSDIHEIIDLRIALLREVGNLKNCDDPSELIDANYRFFAEKMPQNSCLVWVADAGRLVSLNTLIRIEKPPVLGNLTGVEGYILNVYTLPQWRGQGIATALLEKLIAYAKGEQISRLWLRATSAGIGLYQRVGFSSLSDGDPSTALVEMELFLSGRL